MTAQNIFDFTIRHLDAPNKETSVPVLSALEVYQTGVSDELGQANLMTAMCRASDIPSRVVTGLVMPESVPFISISSTYNHPAETHAWVEVFVDDAWTLADPNRSGQFYQRDLFGWTDGKHLVYSEASHESEVFASILQEAEESGTWIAGMSAPLHFVAWSDASIESVQLIPMVSLRKTWDARLTMAFSLVLIIGLLGWLFQDNQRRIDKK